MLVVDSVSRIGLISDECDGAGTASVGGVSVHISTPNR